LILVPFFQSLKKPGNGIPVMLKAMQPCRQFFDRRALIDAFSNFRVSTRFRFLFQRFFRQLSQKKPFPMGYDLKRISSRIQLIGLPGSRNKSCGIFLHYFRRSGK
jgi:hypothetical protein